MVQLALVFMRPVKGSLGISRINVSRYLVIKWQLRYKSHQPLLSATPLGLEKHVCTQQNYTAHSVLDILRLRTQIAAAQHRMPRKVAPQQH
jgi:hypothetical protein